MAAPDSNITLLLQDLRAGKRAVADQLFPLIYNELHRIAAAQMRRERAEHTLQATAVINEAYLRLVAGAEEISWQNRAHFFGISARIMRQVLLDYARQRHAGKRGGEGLRKVDVDAELLTDDIHLEEVIALDEVLDRLSKMDPQQGRIVELRFFAGLSVEETAEVMGMSPRTVKREWSSARAWLERELATSKSG